MREVIVSTGWFAKKPLEENRLVKQANCSPRLFERNYLIDVWRPYILRFIKPKGFLIYLCDCGVYPTEQPKDCEFILSRRSISQNKHNDHATSMLIGAYYAFLNECDFVYIEQDCLVYGLDKALEFARDYQICFGGGDYAYSDGWAENSFVYVKYEFIPEFIDRQNKILFHAFPNKYNTKIPEATFLELYPEVKLWPFGVGRTRPIPWESEVFYAQQLSDTELTKFLER